MTHPRRFITRSTTLLQRSNQAGHFPSIAMKEEVGPTVTVIAPNGTIVEAPLVQGRINVPHLQAVLGMKALVYASKRNRVILLEGDPSHNGLSVLRFSPGTELRLHRVNHVENDTDEDSDACKKDDDPFFGGEVIRTPEERNEHHKIAAMFLVMGLVVRLWGIGHPNQVVFDEVHFGGFTNNYVKNEYFFDIHPPLGKLLLALWSHIIGYKGDLNFSSIGNTYKNNYYWLLRMAPAVAGACLVPVAYLTMGQITSRKSAGILAASLVLLDLTFNTENRLILTDSFMFLFDGLAIYTSFVAWRLRPLSREWYIWLTLSGLCMACAVSVKVTALAIVGALGLRHLARVIEYAERESPERVLYIFLSYSIVGLTIATVFIVSWWFHFHLACKTGPGDIWHDAHFLSTLEGTEASTTYTGTKPGFFEKMTSLNLKMHEANANLDKGHPWGTKWYTWPLNLKGVNCWVRNPSPGAVQNVYMFGNPFVYWVVLLAPVGFFLAIMALWLRGRVIRLKERNFILTGLFFMAGYVLNWLPYILITRVCFIYHFIPSLYFAILLTALIVDYTFGRCPRANQIIVASIILLCLFGFLYWCPWSYGTTVSTGQTEAMRWLSSWK